MSDCVSRQGASLPTPWTSLSYHDESMAEFSTLDVGVLVYAMQLHSCPKQPHLKMFTWPKQLLASLPLTFPLPAHTHTQSAQSTPSIVMYLPDILTFEFQFAIQIRKFVNFR